MQITHSNKFPVPVSTATLKFDKLLQMPSDSLSESIIFQNFLGSMPQTPSMRTSHTMSESMLASRTLTMMTSLAVPPFSKV